jgi:hypothetical protein
MSHLLVDMLTDPKHARSPVRKGDRARLRDTLFNASLSVCRWTTIYYGWRPNLRDEGDNHVVELAVAGGASAIITKNIRDFQGAELHFPGLRILSPEEALKEIEPW